MSSPSVGIARRIAASWGAAAKALGGGVLPRSGSSVASVSTSSAAAGQAAELRAADEPRTLCSLSDGELALLLRSGLLSPHKLEEALTAPGSGGGGGGASLSRAVALRRGHVAAALSTPAAGSGRVVTGAAAASALAALPSADGDFNVEAFYRNILNTNCESVVGYVPLPVGVVGPLLLDGRAYYVPMATTEGALLASTNRGCAAIRRAGGATTALMAEGMTRAPLVRVGSLAEAAALRAWVEAPAGFAALAAAFDSTTRFGRLKSISVATAGRNVYLRFKATTGDAMGMNMITKGCAEALALLARRFPSLRVLSLSGNLCTDKKPSAINWVAGRGKSVSAEVRLSGHVLRSVLKTSADALVDLNTAKNLVGSALAGSVGGFNAHAANVVTALFLATGQDPAQNVESSTCLTLVEKDAAVVDAADPRGEAGAGIVMSVTMPSVEVGTVGGGTSLPAQAACLALLGLRGAHAEAPGAHAAALARVVAGAVLAGELSLLSALTTNDLLSSHMKLNRKPAAGEAAGEAAAGGAGGITPAMLARLAEGGAPAAPAAAHAHAHAAQAHSAPLGSIPGGAPAGAHAHPLHVAPTGHGAHGPASASPGRRYFGAGHRTASAADAGAAAAAAAGGAGWAEAEPFPGFLVEGAGSSSGASAGWDEPRLSVP